MGRSPKLNIRCVAAAAGVSPATASRALNGNASVNEALAQRVLSAARDLGYRPGGSAKAKKNIVFIMPGVSNTYYSKTLTGVLDVAQSAGYRVQLMLSGVDPKQELACLQAACGPDTAGIILVPITNTDPRLAVPELAEIPIVITGPRYLADGLIHVHLDYIEAACQSTRYLLRLGRKNIAFLVYSWAQCIQNYEMFIQEYSAANRGCFTVFDCYTGYCMALEEAGLKPDPSLLAFGGMSYESGCDCTQQLLSSGAYFDAVIAPNDRCGAGVLNSLLAQGFRVPSQVSLVCLDSDLIAKVVSPTLTCMGSVNYEMGRHCAYQMLHLLNGEAAQDVSISSRLLIENSTQFIG